MNYAGTYSIIAFDKMLGQIGGALQSHWFSVGASILWAEAGIGVVVTQSFIEPSYGKNGIRMIKNGKSASAVLGELLSKDPFNDSRQISMLDINGDIATYTGPSCIGYAGHVKGKSYSAQANMMENDLVWKAMEEKFIASKGDLAGRLLNALEAAEIAGGDIRGQQSAALKIVNIKDTGNYYSDVLFDLRIDDHKQPLEELKRLLNVARGYRLMNTGDMHCSKGKFEEAIDDYSQAAAILADNLEARFWHAVTLAACNRLEESKPIFQSVFAKRPVLKNLVLKLPAAKVLPANPVFIRKILS